MIDFIHISFRRHHEHRQILLFHVIGGALVLFPRDTAAYFAWTIKAPIAAVTLGAWFLGLSGFAWAVSRGSRSAIRAAAPATALGSALMLLTTLNHTSAFNWGSPAAWLWLLLYIGAPPTFAVVVFLLKGDSDGAEQRARPSASFRVAAQAAVAVAGGCGAVLFLWPEALIPSWPWPLLPLGARTYAAFALGHALWAWRLARGPADLSGPARYLAIFPLMAFLAPWLQPAAFRKEYFLPFKDYPWFHEARISEICNMLLIRPSHLHWPDLDVDLHVESLENPDHYPLVYR